MSDLATYRAIVRGFLEAECGGAVEERAPGFFVGQAFTLEFASKRKAHRRRAAWVYDHKSKDFDPKAIARQHQDLIAEDDKIFAHFVSPPGQGAPRSVSGVFAARDRSSSQSLVEFVDSAHRSRGGLSKNYDLDRSSRYTEKDFARRAPQRFAEIGGLEASAPIAEDVDERDLLDLLTDALAGEADPEQARPAFPGPRLFVVIGAAGGGKTQLFRALLQRRQSAYMEAKKRRELASRLVPIGYEDGLVVRVDHEAGTVGVSDFPAVMERVREIHMSGYVSQGLFDWLARRGNLIPLFDGLDEIYGNDSNFLEYVEGLLSAPGSQAQVVVFVRDSLVSGNPQLRAALSRYLSGDAPAPTHILRLNLWTPPVRKIFAKKAFKANGVFFVSSMANQLEREIAKSEATQELAKLPYHCDAFVDALTDGKSLPADEMEAMERAIAAMIDRETGKIAFYFRDIVDDQTLDEVSNGPAPAMPPKMEPRGAFLHELGKVRFQAILAALAFESLKGARTARDAGVLTIQQMRQVLQATLPERVLQDEKWMEQIFLGFEKFALLGDAAQQQMVRFANELTVEYLAGQHGARLLDDEGSPEVLAEVLSRREDFATSLYRRTLLASVHNRRALAQMLDAPERLGLSGQPLANARNLREGLAS